MATKMTAEEIRAIDKKMNNPKALCSNAGCFSFWRNAYDRKSLSHGSERLLFYSDFFFLDTGWNLSGFQPSRGRRCIAPNTLVFKSG